MKLLRLVAVLAAALLPARAFSAAAVERIAPSAVGAPFAASLAAPSLAGPAFFAPSFAPALTPTLAAPVVGWASSPSAAPLPAISAVPAALPAAAPALEPTPAAEDAPAARDAAPAAAAPRGVAPKLSLLMERLRAALTGDKRDDLPDEGDFVTIGKAGQNLSLTAGDAKLEAALPLIGKLSRFTRDAALVEVAMRAGRGGLVLEIPFDYGALTKLSPRDLRGAVRDMRLAIAAATEFAPGETVRVRDEADGTIRRATFVGLSRAGGSKKYELRDPDGAARFSPIRLVYKDATGPLAPNTLSFAGKENELWPALTPRRGGELEEFLDGAAWLTSHPDFRAAPHDERVRLLSSYLSAFMRPGEEAALVEMMGLGFPELLKIGVGVCRHFSTLMVAALRESGYDAKLMMRVPEGWTTGHAWVEVEAPSRREEDRLVVDLMNDRVLTWPQALEAAKAAENSLAAIFYTSTERREHPSTVPAAAR